MTVRLDAVFRWRGSRHSRDGLTTIASLDLSGTQVTDAGLVRLKGLKRLSELTLSFTKVTDAGEKKLRQARPNLKIYR